jgi:HD-like signal output (HDOD) protein
LVVMQQAADNATLCQNYDNDTKPWQLQQNTLGFTYAACGAELLNLWQLPDSIVEPLARQHNTQFNSAEPDILISYLAVRLALSNQHPDLYSIKNLVDPFVLELLHLEQADLIKAIDFCNTEGLFILSVLNPRISTIY